MSLCHPVYNKVEEKGTNSTSSKRLSFGKMARIGRFWFYIRSILKIFFILQGVLKSFDFSNLPPVSILDSSWSAFVKFGELKLLSDPSVKFIKIYSSFSSKSEEDDIISLTNVILWGDHSSIPEIFPMKEIKSC